MKKSVRFSAPIALAAALAIPVFTQGCSAVDDLCCNDPTSFSVDGNAQLTGQFQAAAGAVADLSAVAQGSFDDVVNACRAIAIDLDADQAARDAATAAGADKQAEAWCNLAVAQIKGKVTASGSAGLTFNPPKCSASISAKANCQAKCSGSASCDVQATPPTCEGGKLEVSCQGGCTAEGGVSVACEGSCEGNCEGSCSATVEAPSVDCTGTCEGTCEAKAGVGTGTGAQADGTCQGSCKGTCTAKPGTAAIKCGGSCKGSCTAKCSAKAGASVKCDGKCDGKFEPLSCKGGELKGGCKVEAKCDANCEASASAKAECTPPEVSFNVKGNVEARYIASLKANLPNLLVVFQARGEAFVSLIGKVSGSVVASVDGDIGVKGIACLNTLASGISKSGAQMTASVQASGSVVGALK
jgi:hypothetical protein